METIHSNLISGQKWNQHFLSSVFQLSALISLWVYRHREGRILACPLCTSSMSLLPVCKATHCWIQSRSFPGNWSHRQDGNGKREKPNWGNTPFSYEKLSQGDNTLHSLLLKKAHACEWTQFPNKKMCSKNLHALDGTYFQLWTKCRVWSQSMPAENAARQNEVWLDWI